MPSWIVTTTAGEMLRLRSQLRPSNATVFGKAQDKSPRRIGETSERLSRESAEHLDGYNLTVYRKPIQAG